MKATELRIGNLVNYITAEGDVLTSTIDWQDLKWLSEDEKGFNLVHNLIPLTEDFLLKFGFENIGEYNHIDLDGVESFSERFKKGDITFWFHLGNFSYCSIDTFIDCNIEHINQLQNLYFALTGEELTLKNQSK
jgi:hypothetical protein